MTNESFEGDEIIGDKMPSWKWTVIHGYNRSAVPKIKKGTHYDFSNIEEMLQPYVDFDIRVGQSVSNFVTVFKKGSYQRAFLTDCLDYIRTFGRLTHRMMLKACVEYMEETGERTNPKIYETENDQP